FFFQAEDGIRDFHVTGVQTCALTILDLIIALIGFIILSPLFFLILFLLLIANRGSPFFTQLRPGKDEKIFKIIKFKTMNDKKDEIGRASCRKRVYNSVIA